MSNTEGNTMTTIKAMDLPETAVILSPFHGHNTEEHERFRIYRQQCIRHAAGCGWAPYASHQMMTDALDDDVPEDRELGFVCEAAYIAATSAILVYIDHGISPGMLRTLNSLPGHAPHPTFIRLHGDES